MSTIKKIKENVFSYTEAFKESMAYFGGNELLASTFLKKYAIREGEKYYESSPEDMHKRMAQEFSRVEEIFGNDTSLEGLSEYGQRREALSYEKIFKYFENFKYIIPQGSIMAALGNDRIIASLSNCVVIPAVEDSYGGVMHADEQLVQLFKRRCGAGLDISKLRPSSAKVTNSAGTTTGAVSFMERFSNTTREVAQNGRRGALMITIDIAHPDVEDFITIKQDLKKVTGANISVKLSDEFMNAVINDEKFTHKWPIDSQHPIHTKTVKARKLWDKIISAAHKTAEPGLIFWDRQHYYSTSSIYPGYENVSTNPCSEIAMQGGDSCRLIALNLYNFVTDPFTTKAKFDFEKFYNTTYEAQRLMDDVVELELEHIDKILNKVNSDPEPDYIKENEKRTWNLLRETGKNGRRTGLGFTALADAIAALNMKFDSDESIQKIDEIMKTKLRAEFDSSIDMSIQRGAFNGFNPDIENKSQFVHMMNYEFNDLYNRMMKYGRRNISISTVAPTGTLSMLAQTSSGIEPVFEISYIRKRKVNPNDKSVNVSYIDDMGDSWEEFKVYHPKFQDWIKSTGNKDEKLSPYYKSTSKEIDWIKRIEIQAIVQKYTTHSISSTINLPETVSKEKVAEIYEESWKKGLKGITVYRENSRSGVLISENSKPKTLDELTNTDSNIMPPKRPTKIEADIIRFSNEKEKWMAVVGKIDGKPYEIFTGKLEDSFSIPTYVKEGFVIKDKSEEGESSYSFQYFDRDGYKVTIEGLSRSFDEEYWNYAKLISGILRHGMPINFVVDLIEGLNLYDDNINTWKNGVARSLKRYIPNDTKVKDKTCPNCNDAEGLIFQEGCLQCKSCGYSKCG